MRFNMILALFVVAAFVGLDARANPIPVPDAGGQPLPDAIPHVLRYYPTTPVIFKSEKVVYTIDEEEMANVSAMYVLYNTADCETLLNISLPFDWHIPDDLGLSANGLPVTYTKVNYTFEANYTYVNGDLYRSDYAFVKFQLDFAARQTVDLNATYSTGVVAYTEPAPYDKVEPGQTYTRYYWCRYIAETGIFWGNKLDTAQFQFRIKKEFYDSGLKGFNVTHEGGYVVATMTYYDWMPDENINVQWQRPDGQAAVADNAPFVLLVVVLPAVLIGVAILYWRQKRGRS